ncbi:MAG: 4Fe-4S binding protein [Coriobacteriales bacterium]|jgi:polyferredoxin|nr:4Fe-4S binding protein [Coriobacteriales bacterium]
MQPSAPKPQRPCSHPGRAVLLLTGHRRRVVQLLSALLYNLNMPGFATGSIYRGVSKSICVPGLNCYSCPGAIAACPLGSLQSALGAADAKLPLYLVGTILAFGALFARTVCGWLCPFGLIQELLDKVPLPKLRKGRWSRRLSCGKYLVLILAVLLLPLSFGLFGPAPLPFFCAWLCPAGTLEAGIPLVASISGLQAIIGWQFVWKAAMLVGLVAIALFVYRPFCRFLCPLGALYSFFNRFALLRYYVDHSCCTQCGACVGTCKMDIREVSDRECIQCGACARHCEQGAIRFTLKGLLGTASTTGHVVRLGTKDASAADSHMTIANTSGHVADKNNEP